MDWVTDLKVYGSQILAITVTLIDIHTLITILVATASFVYTVYKILELDAKRRYYSKRKKEKDERKDKTDI